MYNSFPARSDCPVFRVGKETYMCNKNPVTLLQAKQRQWRAEEKVMPAVQAMTPIVARTVLEEMKQEGFRGIKDQIQATHNAKVKKIVRLRHFVSGHPVV